MKGLKQLDYACLNTADTVLPVLQELNSGQI